MKKFFLPVVTGLVVLSIALSTGCGGGGGGGGSSTTGTTSGSTGNLSPIQAEAAPAGNLASPIDPLNIQAGQSIQFEVVGYTKTGQRQILTSTNWTTNDNGNTVGSLSSSGLLTATAPSGGIFTATGTAIGKTYSINYKVNPIQATVTGQLDDNYLNAAPNVAVVFYNSSGTVVGRSTSSYNGSFTASVPATAASFSLDPATLPTQYYYKSFVSGTKRYTALGGCNAPLPALTNGQATSLGTIFIDAAQVDGAILPPPPPPDGCS